jgi:colanic acid biosynthesis protein WcaH
MRHGVSFTTPFGTIGRSRLNLKSATPVRLTREQFLEVVARAPLVAIDLVIRDQNNRILLGYRVNEPARNKWFVPGGRIYKGESLEAAFERICENEIEERHAISEARFVGNFTHKYDTNTFLAPDITTHYIVLAYELRLTDSLKPTRMDQHTDFRWFAHQEVDPDLGGRIEPDVHEYVLPYFRTPSQMSEA